MLDASVCPLAIKYSLQIVGVLAIYLFAAITAAWQGYDGASFGAVGQCTRTRAYLSPIPMSCQHVLAVQMRCRQWPQELSISCPSWPCCTCRMTKLGARLPLVDKLRTLFFSSTCSLVCDLPGLVSMTVSQLHEQNDGHCHSRECDSTSPEISGGDVDEREARLRVETCLSASASHLILVPVWPSGPGGQSSTSTLTRESRQKGQPSWTLNIKRDARRQTENPNVDPSALKLTPLRHANASS